MKEIAERLKKEISGGLPGTEIQWALAASDRVLRGLSRKPGKDTTEAAVLILLYPKEKSVHTVFIQRPEYEGVHSGQISFPGGKKEASDPDLISTALREASEEIGVNPSLIRIISALTPLYIPVSDIMVTPVIGWLELAPEFKEQEDEVEFIIEAEISTFFSPSCLKTKPFRLRGEMTDIKYFDYKGNVIWGATAMILNELLAIIIKAGLSAKV